MGLIAGSRRVKVPASTSRSVRRVHSCSEPVTHTTSSGVVSAATSSTQACRRVCVVPPASVSRVWDVSVVMSVRLRCPHAGTPVARHRTLRCEQPPVRAGRSLVKPVTKARSSAGFPKVAVVRPETRRKPLAGSRPVAISSPHQRGGSLARRRRPTVRFIGPVHRRGHDDGLRP